MKFQINRFHTAVLFSIAVTAAIPTLMIGSVVLDDWHEQRIYDEAGILTTGDIVSFKELQLPGKAGRAMSGDYPEVEYTAGGERYRVLINTGHPIPKNSQKSMLGDQLRLIYIAQSPGKARLIADRPNGPQSGFIAALLIGITTVAYACYFGARNSFKSLNEPK